MTEEEKKAIEFLKETCFDPLEYEEGLKSIEIVLNLIQKQDTEINKLKQKNDQLKSELGYTINYIGDHIPRID